MGLIDDMKDKKDEAMNSDLGKKINEIRQDHDKQSEADMETDQTTTN